MLQIHYHRNDLPPTLVRKIAGTAARIASLGRSDARSLILVADALRTRLAGTHRILVNADGIAVHEDTGHHAIHTERLALISAAPQPQPQPVTEAA